MDKSVNTLSFQSFFPSHMTPAKQETHCPFCPAHTAFQFREKKSSTFRDRPRRHLQPPRTSRQSPRNVGQNEVPQGRQSRHHYPRPICRKEGEITSQRFEACRPALRLEGVVMGWETTRAETAKEEGHGNERKRDAIILTLVRGSRWRFWSRGRGPKSGRDGDQKY